MSDKKIVNYPIEVPNSNRCWTTPDGPICQFFTNIGGHGVCDLGFFLANRTPKGHYEKPERCRKLGRRKLKKRKSNALSNRS